MAERLGRLGGVSAQVSPAGPVVDVTGRYAKWFEAAGATVALQRPDFAVFGTAAGPDAANTLVRALRAGLRR